MAYATQDQVLNYLQNGQQTGGQAQTQDPTSSVPVGNAGASGIISGQGGSPNGASPGGVGGQKLWTNIQSYLSANEPGQAQRAEGVKSQIGGVLGKEKEGFEKAQTEAKTSAEKAVEPVTSLGTDKASQLISQAGKLNLPASSNWAGFLPEPVNTNTEPAPSYESLLNPFKSAINAKYTGPENFSYGQSADFQGVGQNVNDQGAFKGFLSQFDKKLQGGRDLSTGQKGLQEQLDSQNEALEKARQDLAAQYAGINEQIGTGVQDTAKYLADQQSAFKTGQNDLYNYLTGESSTDRAQIDDAVKYHNDQLANIAQQANNWSAQNPTLDMNNDWDRQVMDAWRGITDPNGQWKKSGQAAAQQLKEWQQTWHRDKPLKFFVQPGQYDPGVAANESNIYGVDEARNKWNFINDIFGQGNKIVADENRARMGSWTPGVAYRA